MSLMITDLAVGYHKTRVLDHVDLTLRPGRVVALLGENGAGKSSLIKALVGLLKPQSGDIRFKDQDLGGLSRRERARLVAYVPQRGPEIYGLTVRETVYLGRNPHYGVRPGADDRAAVESTITRLSLAEIAERQLSELSGGQAQRALIARALAQQTPVLLLDEPTSALDLRYQLDVLGLIRRLTHDQDLVTVLAIHDLNLAARFCDDFVFVHDGTATYAGDAVTAYQPDRIAAVYGVDVAIDQREDGISVRPLVTF